MAALCAWALLLLSGVLGNEGGDDDVPWADAEKLTEDMFGHETKGTCSNYEMPAVVSWAVPKIETGRCFDYRNSLCFEGKCRCLKGLELSEDEEACIVPNHCSRVTSSTCAVWDCDRVGATCNDDGQCSCGEDECAVAHTGDEAAAELFPVCMDSDKITDDGHLKGQTCSKHTGGTCALSQMFHVATDELLGAVDMIPGVKQAGKGMKGMFKASVEEGTEIAADAARKASKHVDEVAEEGAEATVRNSGKDFAKGAGMDLAVDEAAEQFEHHSDEVFDDADRIVKEAGLKVPRDQDMILQMFENTKAAVKKKWHEVKDALADNSRWQSIVTDNFQMTLSTLGSVLKEDADHGADFWKGMEQFISKVFDLTLDEAKSNMDKMAKEFKDAKERDADDLAKVANKYVTAVDAYKVQKKFKDLMGYVEKAKDAGTSSAEQLKNRIPKGPRKVVDAWISEFGQEAKMKMHHWIESQDPDTLAKKDLVGKRFTDRINPDMLGEGSNCHGWRDSVCVYPINPSPLGAVGDALTGASLVGESVMGSHGMNSADCMCRPTDCAIYSKENQGLACVYSPLLLQFHEFTADFETLTAEVYRNLQAAVGGSGDPTAQPFEGWRRQLLRRYADHHDCVIGMQQGRAPDADCREFVCDWSAQAHALSFGHLSLCGPVSMPVALVLAVATSVVGLFAFRAARGSKRARMDGRLPLRTDEAEFPEAIE